MSYTPKRAMPTSVMQVNKEHGQKGNSVSSRKKESARLKKMGLTKPVAFNIKANTSANYMARWKYVKKLMDREHRKHHAVIPHRSFPMDLDASEAPILVGVIGPPGVGKSLLIKSLVRSYTKSRISDCRGPLTIVANRHRRITFIECPSGDLNAMIDLSKVCDLSLLLVDASYGFEMDTFEYLNAVQQHGLHRIMGVLTHLDKFKKLKKKRSIVYHVKHRFWKEIYAGAKLFVLKGIDEKTSARTYFKSDVVNLVKFISVLKFRPLSWRNSHPYVLVDRYEDMTEPAQLEKKPKMDRTIAFYGYVRGCNFRRTSDLHIPGVGDFTAQDFEEMEDPVPLARKRMRHLMKTGRVYAPMANLGPVVFDKHAAYITLRDPDAAKRDDRKKHAWESEEVYLERMKKAAAVKKAKVDAAIGTVADSESDAISRQHLVESELVDIHDAVSSKMIERMSKVGKSIDESMKESTVQIFADGRSLKSKDVEEMEEHKAYVDKMEALERSRVQRTTLGLASGSDTGVGHVISGKLGAARSSGVSHKRRPVKFDELKKRAVFDDSSKFEDGVGSDNEDGDSSSVEVDVIGAEEPVEFDDEFDEFMDTAAVDDDDGAVAKKDEDSDGDLSLSDEDVEDAQGADYDFNKQLMHNLESANDDLDSKVDETGVKQPDDAGTADDSDTGSAAAVRYDTEKSTGELADSLLESLYRDKESAKVAKKRRQKEAKAAREKAKAKESALTKVDTEEKVPALVSSSAEDSASRWKQHLLAHASEIWKPTMSLFEWVYGDTESALNRKKKIKQATDGGSVPANEDDEGDEEESDSDDEFFKVKGASKKKSKKKKMSLDDDCDTCDSSVIVPLSKMTLHLDKWEESTQRETIRNRFVTGDWVAAQKWQSEVEKRAHNINPDLFDARVQSDKAVLESLGARTEENPENRVYEDTLDWEFRLEQLMKEKGADGDVTMEQKIAFAQSAARADSLLPNATARGNELDLADKKRLKKAQFDASFDAGTLTQQKSSEQMADGTTEDGGHGGGGSKKQEYTTGAKAVFNPIPQPGRGEYYMDIVRDEMKRQTEVNAAEFADETEAVKNEMRGFMPGAYVRIIVESVPCELDTNFDLRYPLVIGGLLPQETEYGLVLCRVKKQRWYNRLLKSNDPVIVSNGWRRFQTLPIYCMEDRSISALHQRLRMIKYTPRHLHCLCLYYGPLSAPNEGVFGYISTSQQDLDADEYRIALSGYVLSSNNTYKLVKKLKVMGAPYEIHKNTAFVKNMFTSNLEASKFVGAKLRTVSGIRGSIKKTEGRFGNFRATFEDKLLKSDIVFLKTWVMVTPKRVHFAVKNLLLSDKKEWCGMRTTGKLKYDLRKKQKKETHKKAALVPFKADSVYVRKKTRKQVTETPLRIPTKLRKELPFALRPKTKESTRVGGDEGVVLRFADTATMKKQQLAAAIRTMADSRQAQDAVVKSRKRKRKRKLEKKREVEFKRQKRARIAKHLSGQTEENESRFEATRGNKFFKEWRLRKQ